MTSLDLVQLRWQQIRAFESHQAIEQENILLRRHIVELRSTGDSLSGQQRNELIQFVALVGNWIRKFKKDAMDAKINYVSGMKETQNCIDMLSKAFQKSMSLLALKSKEATKSRSDNAKIEAELGALQTRLIEETHLKDQEIDRLKNKISRLRDELGQADHSRSLLMHDYTILKDQLDSSQADKDTLVNKYEVNFTRNNVTDYVLLRIFPSNDKAQLAETKRMRSWASKVEEQASQAASECADKELKMQKDHEHVRLWLKESS